MPRKETAMARTWSNKRVPSPATAAPATRRARVTPFFAAMVLAILVFGGLIAYAFLHTLIHPLREAPQAAQDQN